MVYRIKVNGFREKDKVMVYKYGLMVQNMLVSGKIIKRMVMAPSIMLMAMFMRENGSMTKHVDKEPTHIKMGPSMWASGGRINKMVLVFNNGQMDKFMKANTKMEPRLEKVF